MFYVYLCKVEVFSNCSFYLFCVSLCFRPPLRQNQGVLAASGAVLRCDKLDRDEIKNLLMCFLHILKSMSEGRRVCLTPHTEFSHKQKQKTGLTLISFFVT